MAKLGRRNPMRILLIGCGGFIGSHLLDRLLARADTFIEGVDPDTSKIEEHLGHRRFRLHQTKCNDPALTGTLEAAIAAADVTINLSGGCNPAQYNTQPIDVIRAHLFDVYPVVELCAKHGKWLVHFSTSEVYGRTLASYLPGGGYANPDLYELREDETPLIMGPIANQRWTYACAKQLTERLIYGHHAQHGLPFTIIRPMNVFGPRMDFIPNRDGQGVPRVLACFMAALFDGTPLQLVDGGRSRRTIVAVEEVAEAVELMLAKPDKARDQIFNLGNRGNEISIAELADLMRRTYAGITGDARYLDHPIEDVSADKFYGPGYEDSDRRLPDVRKAGELLGWHPKSSVSDILLSAMTYYHERHALHDMAEPVATRMVEQQRELR